MSNLEAAEAATLLIGQFPTSERGDDIFARAVAALLRSFPRSVVADCVNATAGLATTTEFLSLVKIKTWCDERADRYGQEIARAKRIEQQLRDRERPPRTERGMAMTQAWLDRSDPVAAKLAGVAERRRSEAQLAADAKAKLIAEFGRAAFDAVPDQESTFKRLG